MRTNGPTHFRAVAFDLLTALVDSWSLWIDVSGKETLGRAWRRESLRLVTSAGRYRPYEDIVVEAGRAVGVTEGYAEQLIEQWSKGKLRAWPEAPEILAKLSNAGWRTAVVTNCSQRLAEIAAAATGHHFDEIVSAERAGVYKTDPGAYLAGLSALGVSDPSSVLFVAGSPHDVPGASAVGMPVYWSNRFNDLLPENSQPPLMNEKNLLALPDLLAASPVAKG